jgi:hypothetical protein
MEAIKAKFSHITPRDEKTFNVIFIGADGVNLNTICKWIKNSYDVNHYISLDSGYVIGLNKEGMYSISEEERLKAVKATGSMSYMNYPPRTKVRIKSTGETGGAFERFSTFISVFIDDEDKCRYFSMDDIEFINQP